jgi:hypothetical protein
LTSLEVWEHDLIETQKPAPKKCLLRRISKKKQNKTKEPEEVLEEELRSCLECNPKQGRQSESENQNGGEAVLPQANLAGQAILGERPLEPSEA